MHNSENGAPVDPNHVNGNEYLLKYGTPSETCLSCHATGLGRVWQAPTNANPFPYEKGGGNFGYLTDQTNNYNDASSTAPLTSSYCAHNVIAPSYTGGVAVADPVNMVAPGGTYPASEMSCTSCHDPHGGSTLVGGVQVDNFRILYGVNHVEAGSYNFSNPAPTATGISLSDSSGGLPVAESPTNHTAYKGGMSAWCSNCHTAMHNPGAQTPAKFFHPSGVGMGSTIANNYSTYNGTGQASNPTPSHSYVPQVAFEDASMTTTSDAPPTTTSQVSCISCHRAHGTSAPNIGRWDFNVSSWSKEGQYGGTFKLPNPYAATAGTTQRSLCNKCHIKDNS